MAEMSRIGMLNNLFMTRIWGHRRPAGVHRQRSRAYRTREAEDEKEREGSPEVTERPQVRSEAQHRQPVCRVEMSTLPEHERAAVITRQRACQRTRDNVPRSIATGP